MKKLAILVSLIVAPAYASTINITIPVKIENLMPTVTQVRVECRLFAAKPPGWFTTPGDASYIQKMTPDQAGKVQQVVQATINTNPDKPDPQYYQCGFQLGLVDGSWVDPDPSSAKEAAKARQGMPFRAREEGSILQQLKMQEKQ